jgi:hypothetical protein
MTQVQLAHTEAQRFALVQNVAEMENQVAEVEVWQAMAHQGQEPPIAPPAAPAASDELQGASGLSEDTVSGPPPASPDTSAGSTAGYLWFGSCLGGKSCTLNLASSGGFCVRVEAARRVRMMIFCCT